MNRVHRTLVVTAALAVGLPLLHLVLLHGLAGRNVVAVVLAAGPHAPAGTLLLAGLFLVVRIAAVWLLPGFILSGLGLALYEWLACRATGDDARSES